MTQPFKRNMFDVNHTFILTVSCGRLVYIGTFAWNFIVIIITAANLIFLCTQVECNIFF